MVIIGHQHGEIGHQVDTQFPLDPLNPEQPFGPYEPETIPQLVLMTCVHVLSYEIGQAADNRELSLAKVAELRETVTRTVFDTYVEELKEEGI